MKYSVTSEDMAKTPVMYIAFYDNQNRFVTVTVKDDIISSDEFTITMPSGCEKCKVMILTTKLIPLCEADDCE